MINHNDVKRIANLARLEIGENELDKFTAQMNQILKFIESLEKLDTSKVEPTSHAIDVTNAFRKDEVQIFDKQDKVFENAPQQEENLFIVPKVI